MNAPIILNQALTVHGEVSKHLGMSQSGNTLVTRDVTMPLLPLRQAAPSLLESGRGGGSQSAGRGVGSSMVGDLKVTDSGAMVSANPDGTEPDWRDLGLWEYTEQLKRASERDIQLIKRVVNDDQAVLHRVGEAVEHFRENVHQGDLIRDAWVKQQMEGIANRVHSHEESMTANLE